MLSYKYYLDTSPCSVTLFYVILHSVPNLGDLYFQEGYSQWIVKTDTNKK